MRFRFARFISDFHSNMHAARLAFEKRLHFFSLLLAKRFASKKSRDSAVRLGRRIGQGVSEAGSILCNLAYNLLQLCTIWYAFEHFPLGQA